ncbi:MAG TPA: hypothetical protein VG708_10030 [Mycobacteriales bacterium]|nr:hypothetical protein [Mycobacteriales bacterium]
MNDVIEPLLREREATEHSEDRRLWVRRAILTLLFAVSVLALFNVFGQRAGTSTVRSSAADLTVHAPSRVRAGLLFQAKITIVAHRELPKASLVLGNGWFDGLTINTNEPQASSESSGPGGGAILQLGSLSPGETYVHYLEFQVNPTSIGSRTQRVTVRSDGVPLVSFSHGLTVFP